MVALDVLDVYLEISFDYLREPACDFTFWTIPLSVQAEDCREGEGGGFVIAI